MDQRVAARFYIIPAAATAVASVFRSQTVIPAIYFQNPIYALSRHLFISTGAERYVPRGDYSFTSDVWHGPGI